MEPLPFPAGPSDDELLRDLSTCVGGVPNSNTSYSSVIRVSKNAPIGLHFSVTLKSRRGARAEEILCHTYVADAETSSSLQVIRTLVACSAWTHGKFVFHDPGLDDLILEIFSLLRSSRSLATLDIQSEPYYHRHLPTLLCENLFVETLTLNPGVTQHREDAERIALCFSRNSVLKSCTSAVNFKVDFQMWEIALRPFMTSLKSEANVALKELEMLEISQGWVDATFGERAIANNIGALELVRNELRLNTSLQSLVVGEWKLLRAGVDWQMIYCGPCLAVDLQTAEYDVKVKMRQ